MKTNILITSAGTGAAFATAESSYLNFKDEISIFLTDINLKHLVSSSIFSNNFFQSPSIYDANYIDFILNLIHNYEINYVIPFIDLDVQLLSKLYEEKKIDFDIHVKSLNTAEICADKYLSYKWLKSNEINTPSTFLLNENIDLENFIVKPKLGFGSQIKITNKNCLSDIKDSDKYVVQQICENPEITIDVFKDNSNKIYILCRERIEIKSGVCTKAKVFFDEELYQIAKQISNGLNLNYFCFQVMKLNNNWAVTDINPRYGAGTAMGQVIGMDFYSAMLANILNIEPDKFISQYRSQNYITRQYRNILSN